MADTIASEPRSREEWEASLAEDIQLFESSVSSEGRESAGDIAPASATEEDEEEGAPAEDAADGPAEEAQSEDADEDAGSDEEIEEPGAEPDEEGEDESAAAADPAAPHGEDTRSTDAPPKGPELQPFAVKADKKEFSLERAVITKVRNERGEDEEYIVMPRSTWERQVQPNFRDQSTLQQRELELRRELAARDPQANAEVIFARTLTSKLDELLRSEGDNWDEALIDWALEYRKALPNLLQEAQQQSESAQGAAREGVRSQEDVDRELAALQSSFEAALTSTVDEYLGRDEFKGIGRDELLEDLVDDYGLNLFTRADQDYPEVGVKAGQWVLRVDVVESRIQREATRAQRRAQAASRAAEVQAKNEERVRGGRKVRASVTGAQQLARGNSSTPRAIESREDWENSLNEEFGV